VDLNILHVIDRTTGLDALDTIALITNSVPGRHEVLVLGHRSWMDAALLAGVPRTNLKWSRGVGILDPTVRRAVHREIGAIRPTHVHAWGTWGLKALSGEIGFDGPHIFSLQTPPPPSQIGRVRDAARHKPWLLVSPCHITLDALITTGAATRRMVSVNPGTWRKSNDPTLSKNFRRSLGLEPREGPVALLGGWPEKNIRHDHAIWAIGLASKIHTQMWGIIRTDHALEGEGGNPYAGYEYFKNTFEDPGLIAMAPASCSWPQLLMLSELFVFTPESPAGMNGLLAAMAAGKAIVSTSTPQVREILQDGRNALLAPAGNPREIAGCITRLLADPKLRNRLGRVAKAVYERACRPEILVQQMESIYAQTGQDPQLLQPVVLPGELNNLIGKAD
jgi:Glycosyl transferases group 1